MCTRITTGCSPDISLKGLHMIVKGRFNSAWWLLPSQPVHCFCGIPALIRIASSILKVAPLMFHNLKAFPIDSLLTRAQPHECMKKHHVSKQIDPRILTRMEESRQGPREFDPGVSLFAESDVDIETSQILHLDPNM